MSSAVEVVELNRVLVVAAHPDGEGLSCGGAIALHTDAGGQVQMLIVTEGATFRKQKHNCFKTGEELSTAKVYQQRTPLGSAAR